ADSWDPPGIAPATKLEVGKGDITSLQIELGKGASITGEIVDTDGAPVADANVTASKTSGNDFGTAKTGADGRFVIKLLAGDGEYQLGAHRSTGVLALRGEPPRVVVPSATAEVTGIRIVVPVGHLAISGHVRRGRAPAVGVEVRAFGPGG